nr:MAG TPA: hypothetical protein [Caudoviricetes sp.]
MFILLFDSDFDNLKRVIIEDFVPLALIYNSALAILFAVIKSL